MLGFHGISAAAISATEDIGSILLAIASGAYTVSGSDTTLKRFTLFAAASGSYAVTGTDAEFLYINSIMVGSGSVTVNGSPVTFVATGVSLSFAADAGSYTVTGSSLTLLKTFRPSALSGAYTVTGTSATFTIGDAPVAAIPVNLADLIVASGETITVQTAPTILTTLRSQQINIITATPEMTVH